MAYSVHVFIYVFMEYTIYRRGVQILQTTLWRTMVVNFMELALAASSWAVNGSELIILVLKCTLLMQDVIR